MTIKIIAPETPCNRPLVSVIIPTLNEELYIEKVLIQLSEQTISRFLFEVIVVDGGSVDNTCLIVKSCMEKLDLNIQLLFNEKKISSSARNIGINFSSGEYVLFVDAHVFIPSNELIVNMLLSAHREEALVLGRSQPLNAPFLNGFQTVVARVRSSFFGHSTKSFIYSDYEGWVSPVSVGVMYRRSIFSVAGYFDESFDAAEDVEFNYRLELLGYQAYISPGFRILYYPRNTVSGLVKQMFRYGLGRARFVIKHYNGFRAEVLVPVFVVLVFTIFLLGFFSSISICLFSLFLYIVLFYFFGRKLSGIFQKVFAPLCLLIIHLGLAAGLLYGFGKQCFKRK